MVAPENSEKLNNSRRNRYTRILIAATLIILTIGLSMGHYFTQHFNKNKIFNEFLKNYRNQYIEIVYGKKNYCDQRQHIDTSSLFGGMMENKILHQEQALHQIEIALRNESDLNVIAIVGPVGVGKTLFITALQEKFPWPENVHIYSWNTYVQDEAKQYHLLSTIIEDLSECGQNLLVIENLHVHDHGVVTIINKMLAEANKIRHKRVVLFYVFTLNTMLTAEMYAVQYKTLGSLPNCNVIYFKSFSEPQLRDCIKREAELEDVALTKRDYDEIVETIDPFKSGCKNVKAKVLVYGRNK